MFPALLAPVAAAIMAISPVHATSQSYAHYTVRPGDSLSKIAARTLGTARSWPKLWWKNRHQVHNPNVIAVGERLIIPGLRRTWPYQRAAALAAIPAPKPLKVSAISTASPPPAAATPVSSPAVAASGFEGCVIARESGGNPTAYNNSSGASGLFGFLLSTWMATPEGAGYPGGAYTAPAGVQEAAFAYVYAREGTAPWAPYDGC